MPAGQSLPPSAHAMRGNWEDPATLTATPAHDGAFGACQSGSQRCSSSFLQSPAATAIHGTPKRCAMRPIRSIGSALPRGRRERLILAFPGDKPQKGSPGRQQGYRYLLLREMRRPPDYRILLLFGDLAFVLQYWPGCPDKLLYFARPSLLCRGRLPPIAISLLRDSSRRRTPRYQG